MNVSISKPDPSEASDPLNRAVYEQAFACWCFLSGKGTLVSEFRQQFDEGMPVHVEPADLIAFFTESAKTEPSEASASVICSVVENRHYWVRSASGLQIWLYRGANVWNTYNGLRIDPVIEVIQEIPEPNARCAATAPEAARDPGQEEDRGS